MGVKNAVRKSTKSQNEPFQQIITTLSNRNVDYVADRRIPDCPEYHPRHPPHRKSLGGSFQVI